MTVAIESTGNVKDSCSLFIAERVNSVCLSNAGTASTRADISAQFLMIWSGTILVFEPQRRYKIPREPARRDVKYTKVGEFCNVAFYLENVRDRSVVTTEH